MSKTKMVVPLTTEEKDALGEHELTISQGIHAFVAVGQALLAIRDGKLYRADYKTFEDYCRQRWDFGRSRAYRLMEAAEVASDLSPNGQQMVTNERQARALALVPNHLREEVLQRVKDGDEEVTEQSVTRAVVALLDEKRAAARERDKADAETDADPEAVTEDEDQDPEGEVEGEDESDSDADSASDEDASEDETPTEKAARRGAKKCAKDRLYLARGLERLRLAVKDFRKLNADDLATADARLALRQALDAADEVFSDVRLLVGEAEKAAAK